jgi:hypothetical protein
MLLRMVYFKNTVFLICSFVNLKFILKVSEFDVIFEYLLKMSLVVTDKQIRLFEFRCTIHKCISFNVFLFNSRLNIVKFHSFPDRHCPVILLC